MTQFNFNTTSEDVVKQLADEINDKVVLITGCTWLGIGADNARALASVTPKLIIITGRSQSKLDETVSNIKKDYPNVNLRTLLMDLSSLSSVRKAANEVNNYSENIDVLINNAGIMACPYGKTEDGFELQFGTNHLGHFLFTNLILDKILASKKPRIVNLTSFGHRYAPIIFEDPNFTKGARYEGFVGYGQSKTANILFSRELNQRYNSRGLTAFSVHPGVIYGTNLGKHIDVSTHLSNLPLDYWGRDNHARDVAALKPKTLSQGGATTLVAAFDPSIASLSGGYLTDCEVRDDLCQSHAKQLNDAFKLWTLSEELVGQKF